MDLLETLLSLLTYYITLLKAKLQNLITIGSDLAGETAAALAATSLVFKDRNATYSQEVLTHALELYNFAVEYRGLYHEAIPGAKIYYE